MVRLDIGAAGDGERLLAGVYTFCDRVVNHQGVQGPPEALMMGYSMQVRDGMVCNACVADQASIAAAVLETIALRPNHPRAAVWLARFDYTKAEIPTFTDCAPEVILYTTEGIVAGMQYLVETQGVASARNHPAAKQFTAMAQWLVDHQDGNCRWPEPPERGYRDYSAGIPWRLLRMDALVGPNPAWQVCAARFLAGLATPEGERYYGLYIRPFTTGWRGCQRARPYTEISLMKRFIREYPLSGPEAALYRVAAGKVGNG
jgi:hypothetical protein